MPRATREQVMTALYNALVATLQISFAADTSAGQAVLLNPSSTTGLLVGLPVVGGSIPRGALIQNLSPLTLSLPATANAHQAALTAGFITTGRRLKYPKDVTSQPALFLRGDDEELIYQQQLQQQVMRAEVWIYSSAGDNPDITPETALNNLLDALQLALAPDDPLQQRYTIGGLVFWARMMGRVIKWPGDLDGQAVAVAEIEIIVP